MSLPSEGLNAVMYVGTACPATSADVIALFQGVDISWTQTKRRWYPMGSLNPIDVLNGVIAWDGSYKKGYLTNAMIGSFNVGTYVFCGSIVPRGGNSPAILGSVVLTGGSLSNMEAENEAATMEDEGFIIYNLTFIG